MKRSNLSVLLSLLLVFGSGVLVGSFGYRLYTVRAATAETPVRSRDKARRDYVSGLQKRLGLTPDQLTQLNQILDQTHARFEEIHKQIEPQMKQLRQENHDRVSAMLTPSQRVEYEKWRAERDSPKTPH